MAEDYYIILYDDRILFLCILLGYNINDIFIDEKTKETYTAAEVVKKTLLKTTCRGLWNILSEADAFQQITPRVLSELKEAFSHLMKPYKCKKCGEEKEYYCSMKQKIGMWRVCKKCNTNRNKTIYREKRNQNSRNYYCNNKQKCKEAQKKSRSKMSEEKKKLFREARLQYQKEYYIKNKEKRQLYCRERYKKILYNKKHASINQKSKEI